MITGLSCRSKPWSAKLEGLAASVGSIGDAYETPRPRRRSDCSKPTQSAGCCSTACECWPTRGFNGAAATPLACLTPRTNTTGLNMAGYQ